MSYTPYFITVNGLSLSLREFQEETQDVDVFERGGAGEFGLDGVTYAPKRRWMFETVPIVPNEAEALVGWLEGRGVQFSFDVADTATTRFTLCAHDGTYPRVFPTGTTASYLRGGAWRSAVSKFGTWALQLSGTSTAYDGTSTTYPFTYAAYTATFGQGDAGRVCLSYWARNTASGAGAIASFTLLSTIWDADASPSTAVYYVGSAATLPDSNGLPFRYTSTFLATVGFCSFTLLSGASVNSASTALFDQIHLVPYRPTASMLAARVARAEAEAQFPYVKLGGHALQDPLEVEVKCFVEERQPVRVHIDGVWYDNAEVLSGVFVER
jgi:hypothetical protein